MTDQQLDDYVVAWKRQLWQGWNERQWLEAFPEAKEIIPEKVKEWEEIAKTALVSCIQCQRVIKREAKDEISRMFWLEWVKWNEGKRLLDACIQLDRLTWLQLGHKSQESSFKRFGEAMERARTADIVGLAERYLPKLRRSGRNYYACCVFHEEKTPSFYLYPETSSFHCFGCQAHGDAIDLVMKLENVDFKGAVRQLGGI